MKYPQVHKHSVNICQRQRLLSSLDTHYGIRRLNPDTPVSFSVRRNQWRTSNTTQQRRLPRKPPNFCERMISLRKINRVPRSVSGEVPSSISITGAAGNQNETPSSSSQFYPASPCSSAKSVLCASLTVVLTRSITPDLARQGEKMFVQYSPQV